MKFSEKEGKIARLALDKAAKDGEYAAAAIKLIESLRNRGVTVEDLQGEAESFFDVLRKANEAAPEPEPPPKPEPEPEPEPYVEPEPYISPGQFTPDTRFEEMATHFFWILIVVFSAIALLMLLIGLVVWILQSCPMIAVLGLVFLFIGLPAYLRSRFD